MQNALWLASIFGPFLAILGLWMLLYVDNMMKVWTSIKATPSSFYLSSVFALLVGLAVLSQYDMWSMDVLVLVTLFGWVMIIRGVLGLFIPQLLLQMTLGNASFMKVMGIIPLAWGIALCWAAFFM